jgi:hypothetical protein
MSINITPIMQRSTKPFCWVYHLQKSQLKRTLFVSAVLLRVFGSSNVFLMQIWDSFLTKNHLSCKQSQTLPLFGALWCIYLFQQQFEFFWWESITFKIGKNMEVWLQLWTGFRKNYDSFNLDNNYNSPHQG